MLHRNVPTGDVHIPYNWEVADSNARDALSDISVNDIGKWCRVVSNNSIWMLISVSPLTWSRVTGNMDGPEAALAELLPVPSAGTKVFTSVNGAFGWATAPAGTAMSDYVQNQNVIPNGDTVIVEANKQFVVIDELEIQTGGNIEILSGGNLILRD